MVKPYNTGYVYAGSCPDSDCTARVYVYLDKVQHRPIDQWVIEMSMHHRSVQSEPFVFFLDDHFTDEEIAATIIRRLRDRLYSDGAGCTYVWQQTLNAMEYFT